jgi:hypothetical protein
VIDPVGPPRDVQLAAQDLQADGGPAGRTGDEGRDGAAIERAAVDGAVGRDGDEEGLRLLVERDALGIAGGIRLQRESRSAALASPPALPWPWSAEATVAAPGGAREIWTKEIRA